MAGAGLGAVDVLAAGVFAPTVDSLRTQNKNLLDITKYRNHIAAWIYKLVKVCRGIASASD